MLFMVFFRLSAEAAQLTFTHKNVITLTYRAVEFKRRGRLNRRIYNGGGRRNLSRKSSPRQRRAI